MGTSLLKIIHIEPTTRCTIGCPQCPRTEHIDMVSIQDCNITDMTKACAGFDLVHLCGNHGDPIYHPQFHKLISTLRSDNPTVMFSMHTNGAFRNQEWWKTTARLFTGQDSITFSIDGLPSNNHIYRVNSRWQSVHDAVTTLRKYNADLQLIWKWIVFKYNQDDITTGIDLATDLGFDRFLMVKSYRRQQDDPLTSTMTFDDLKEQISAKSLR